MTLVATRPTPGTARPYAFPELRRVTMRGGTVVAAHLPGQLLATAMLMLDAGAAREAAGREGTATVLAKSLEEGTKSRDSAAYALALEGLGAELSPSVDWDAFRVSVSAPVPLLLDAVRLAAEAARTPRRDPADVERVRDDEVTALRMDWAQPGPRADAALRADLFGAADRYGRPLHGDPTSVAAVTVDDVLDFHRSWLLRPGMLLIAGDLDSLDLAALGEAAFAGTGGEPLAAEGPLGVPVRDRRRVILVDRPGSVQSTLRIGHRAPERATPDYVPMTLAATVLGGAFTSRLNHLIREVRGYTYGIRGSYAMARGGARGGALLAGRPAVGGDADAGIDRGGAEHAGPARPAGRLLPGAAPAVPGGDRRAGLGGGRRAPATGRPDPGGGGGRRADPRRAHGGGRRRGGRRRPLATPTGERPRGRWESLKGDRHGRG